MKQNPISYFLKLSGYTLLIVGLITAGVILINHRDTRQLAANGRTATATVVDKQITQESMVTTLSRGISLRTHTSYRLDVSFDTAETKPPQTSELGEGITLTLPDFSEGLALHFTSLSVFESQYDRLLDGSPVEIIFDPDDPDRAILAENAETPWSDYFIAVIAVGLGFLLAIGGHLAR